MCCHLSAVECRRLLHGHFATQTLVQSTAVYFGRGYCQGLNVERLLGIDSGESGGIGDLQSVGGGFGQRGARRVPLTHNVIP